MNIVKFLRTAFFIEHPRWVLLTILAQYGKVSWGVLIKNKKRCTNNYLLSHDNTISSLLELINHMLSISEYALEKH